MCSRTGEAEIVSELAAPLPAQMIGLLLGFPDEMWPKLQHWSETTIALGGGPRYHDEAGVISAMEFAVAAAELYEAKKGCPADDVMSHWIDVEREGGGEVGGSPFGLDQIISDCLLLLDGGAETTRTVIARTLLALADHPDEWAKLQAGADMEVAVEEFIRWVTPVHNFCRVATEDYELHGETIEKGQQVLLAYAGANRDPAHFDRPRDLRRHPRPEPPHLVRLRHPLLHGRIARSTRDPDLLRAPRRPRRGARAADRRASRRDAQRVRLRPQGGPHGFAPKAAS